MSRDWKNAFKPASFKGGSFHVDVESASGGRRVSVQNYAYGESHISEDWGKKARELPAQIYVASDLADAEIMALMRLFESAGPGLLILPMQAPVMVHLTDYNMDRSKRINGFIPCRTQFIHVGSGVKSSGFSFNAGLSGLRTLGKSIAQGLL